MRFFKLLDELGLSQKDASEMFAITLEEFNHWRHQNSVPFPVQQQLNCLNLLINSSVNKWIKYAKWHSNFGNRVMLGIPSYSNMDDYHACDQDLSKELLFLPLYGAFTKRLIESLEKVNINAKAMLIDFEAYYAWLEKYDFDNCPSARIVYASLKLSKKIHARKH